MFTVTGVVHFLPGWRDDLAAMIPPALVRPGLPGPHLLVTVTGVLELGGAVALLVPAAAPYAAAGLALLLAAMVPADVAAARPGLPGPHLLVTVTGVLELGGAVALLVPAAALYAAAGLALLMAAMFPANVSAARRGVPLRGRPPTPLPLRTVLQAVFIAAAV